jgi:hypothetical protein
LDHDDDARILAVGDSLATAIRAAIAAASSRHTNV